jgi:hypothetical protein
VSSQECGNLSRQDLPLQLDQERLGLGETQTEVFEPLVLFVQHDDLVDAHLLVIAHYH